MYFAYVLHVMRMCGACNVHVCTCNSHVCCMYFACVTCNTHLRCIYFACVLYVTRVCVTCKLRLTFSWFFFSYSPPFSPFPVVSLVCEPHAHYMQVGCEPHVWCMCDARTYRARPVFRNVSLVFAVSADWPRFCKPVLFCPLQLYAPPTGTTRQFECPCVHLLSANQPKPAQTQTLTLP